MSDVNLKDTHRPRSLIEALKGRIPELEFRNFRRSFDVIGDILILQPTEEMEKYRKEITDAIRFLYPRIRVILAKKSPVEGETRVAKYEEWYGDRNYETIHREYGCIYYLDITKVFFTPRLSTERNRVSNLVKEGEIVCDLFAGVGPFSILIAKKGRASLVYACDINEFAYKYMRKNVIANRVGDTVKTFLGDAREIAKEKLYGKCDRVIMNLPKSSELFLDAARYALKPSGGMIHLYTFRREEENLERKVEKIKEKLREAGFESFKIDLIKKVREIGPREYNEVLDIVINKISS